MIPLVLTFVGDDRPGLVNAISDRIAACGGNLAGKPLGATGGEIRGYSAGQCP